MNHTVTRASGPWLFPVPEAPFVKGRHLQKQSLPHGPEARVTVRVTVASPIICVTPSRNLHRLLAKRSGSFTMGFEVAKEVPMPGETESAQNVEKRSLPLVVRHGVIAALPPRFGSNRWGSSTRWGTGVFRPHQNYLFQPRELPQVCFVECKASRALIFYANVSDDGQLTLCMMERKRNLRNGKRKRGQLRGASPDGGAGKIRSLPDAADGKSALCARAGGG